MSTKCPTINDYLSY